MKESRLKRKPKKGKRGDCMVDVWDENQRKHIMKRLRATKRNESICLQGWEVAILLRIYDEQRDRINELEEKTDE